MALPELISKIMSKKMSFHALLKDVVPNEVIWISAQINSDHQTSLLSKNFDFISKNNNHALRIISRDIEFDISCYLNEKLQSQKLLQQNSDDLVLFNQKWDALIEAQIDKIKKSFDLSVFDYPSVRVVEENEKALEWIRVSFVVLEKAIRESLTNPELLFQLQLFIGTNPKTKLSEIRAIIFNLDIKFLVLENGLLHVSIFDDKNREYGASKQPVLTGDFSTRRKEIFDELIKILALISMGIKLN